MTCNSLSRYSFCCLHCMHSSSATKWYSLQTLSMWSLLLLPTRNLLSTRLTTSQRTTSSSDLAKRLTLMTCGAVRDLEPDWTSITVNFLMFRSSCIMTLCWKIGTQSEITKISRELNTPKDGPTTQCQSLFNGNLSLNSLIIPFHWKSQLFGQCKGSISNSSNQENNSIAYFRRIWPCPEKTTWSKRDIPQPL